MHDYANLPKREINTVPGTSHNNASESKKNMLMSNKKGSENDNFSQL